MKNPKHEIITFKVDESLWESLKGIPNRSEFIRRALLNALGGACPLCGGTGTLSLKQKEHFESFLAGHSLEECRKCHEIHLVCRVS